MMGNISNVTRPVFADDGTFPNSAWPVLIYRAALVPDEAGAEAFEALFDANGWPPQWRDGIYDYHHYHSLGHEALGVAAGRARLRLGGPGGAEFEVAAGDVVVLPAGVAHQRIAASDDFLVVGAYPPGQEADILTGAENERPDADAQIAALGAPQTDPVGGAGGALLVSWR